jgi:uncharacterized membrane protein
VSAENHPILPQEGDHQLEQAMGRMLQVGVTVAAVVVLLGGLLFLAQTGGLRPDYSHFQPSSSRQLTIAAIFDKAMHLNPSGVVELGMLLLIATPIGRVVFGLVGFARMRDHFYTVVSALVLTILLLSFFTRY